MSNGPRSVGVEPATVDVSPALRELAQPRSARPGREEIAPDRSAPKAVPAPALTFPGIGSASNFAIEGFRLDGSSSNSAPNHSVRIENGLFSFYSGSGTLLAGPARTSALWNGFGGVCETLNGGDPIVLYDEVSDRWLITQFTEANASPTHQCVAISTSGDPAGTWNRYAFPYAAAFNSDSLGASTDGVAANGGVATLKFVINAAPLLQYKSSSFTDGNANGSIDPSECMRFTVQLDNLGVTAATGITATLSSSTPGVSVPQAVSPYRDMAGNGTGANQIRFDVGTSAGFVCGSTVNFTLNVTTNEGPFSIPFSKTASGSPGSFTSFASPDGPTPIRDLTTTYSTVNVTGITGLVNTVTVSVHAEHPWISDVNLQLNAPDWWTWVPLVTGRGSGWGWSQGDFGYSCEPETERTMFDDSAAMAIGEAPLVTPFAFGSWRPESPLSAMRGQNPNGTWELAITDTRRGEQGHVYCWTLNVQNLTCAAGSGVCMPCPSPPAPGISGSGFACPGTPISLTASAGGYSSYQWYLNNALIAGATSQTYNVASATSANGGSYTVTGTTATCGAASLDSARFVVTVPAPAAPTVSGTSSVCPGGSINLSANGGYDSYQWYFGGVLIGGATSQTYNVAAATVADAGNYTVTGTTNTCNLTSAQSAQFNVSLIEPPAAPGISGTSLACQATAIDLIADSGFDSYQWYFEGNLIVGATSQTYSIASATSADAGNYTVTGTTSTCTLTSAQSAQFAVAVPSCLVTPTALAVDGNGVFEAGETIALTPSWDNDGDISLDLFGNLSSFTGPGTSTYTLTDDAGSYGSVAAGATAAASDTYGLTVSVPAARPSTHWDASVMEIPGTIPNSVNSAKTWSLHMGNSFLDVATSYAFYREIETLLHNNVTLGCGDGTQYCKDNPTPRISMAVFIARAELGSDAAVPVSGTVGASSYNCTVGGSSLYTDVAVTNQFCKHVHYIASQNITQGCTATTFCPSQNVTRIQMAIFLARALAGSDGAVPTAYSDPDTGRSYDLPNGSRAFTDLVGTTFEKQANYVWALGITDGCTGTMYCPSNLLTRGQMAKFLVGTYNMLLYKP